ncbi:helix-turn-helix transcriptional regulator [Halostella salina]|uniref:helix-turn-helix transcriptional regulator n=1 Tax=Halostella salina TaxID=1547897 RepID=UPI000EF7FED1|nr:GntR family transcriptional regulator [Halostella salina]
MARTDVEPDVIDLVTRRVETLERLDGAVADKGTLAADLSVSRSTVDRALRELEGAGFVTRVDGGYTVSASGRLAVRSYREFVDALDAVDEAGPLLAELPADAPITLDAVRGGTVHRAQPPTPYRPVERLTELVTAADEFRGLAAAVTAPESVERIAAATLDGEVRTEIVLAASVADHLRESYPDVVSGTVESGVDVYETDTLPFGLALTRDGDTERVAVAVYGPESELRGVVVNDSPAAVEWGEATFERYRAAADEFGRS